MAISPGTPAPIEYHRALPTGAKSGSCRAAHTMNNRSSPAARCRSTDDTPASALTPLMNTYAMPNEMPLVMPSTAPSAALPSPPGVYDARNSATAPSSMPAADTAAGVVPPSTSQTTGTAARSTDDSGATTPILAIEYPV